MGTTCARHLVLPALGLLLLRPAPGLGEGAGPGEGGGARFSFERLKSDSGVLRCALYAAEKDHLRTSFREVLGVIAGRRATCVFTGVAAGAYSMCAFHDENNNGKLDANFLGIPKEGVACSNQARGRMGPPRWKDALFRYDGGARIEPPQPALVFRY